MGCVDEVYDGFNSDVRCETPEFDEIFSRFFHGAFLWFKRTNFTVIQSVLKKKFSYKKNQAIS